MLQLLDIKKSFRGVQALKGVSLSVRDRSIVGIIGMNGSGKTTLLNCVNGLYTTDSGEIVFDGKSLIGLTPNRVAAMGIGRTFQVPKVFSKLTLLDNLEIPQIPLNVPPVEAHRRSSEWLKKVALHTLAHNYAEELSGGQQKLLELARIMVARPKLILLDEPFAGVNPELALLMIEVIQSIPKEHECSVVLVSHDLTSVYRLSDHIFVLNEGQVLCEGDAEMIRNNPAVVEAYLGAD
ncbi:ABC transporter ATP-binding protein [Alcaligenaceae bacterium]|nr:ABC transporter ATP-binding protein [Alcaligenaceae bacterium]